MNKVEWAIAIGAGASFGVALTLWAVADYAFRRLNGTYFYE